MICKNSLDAESYAEVEGMEQMRSIAIEDLADEIYDELYSVITDSLPKWAISEKMLDVLYANALIEARSRVTEVA